LGTIVENDNPLITIVFNDTIGSIVTIVELIAIVTIDQMVPWEPFYHWITTIVAN
jgi:hypothetical protein